MTPPAAFRPPVAVLCILLGAGVAPAAFADEALAERAGCMNCHSVNEAGLGPSYTVIGTRYRGSLAARGLLGERIANGGKGNWTKETGGLGMPPYSNLLSAEEIRTLVEWILAQGTR